MPKNIPNNLKLVGANSVYEIGETFALPRKSIGGYPKMQARSLHSNRNTIWFAALGKHNRDWPQASDRAFSTRPLRIFHRGSVPEIVVEGETGFIVGDIDRAVEAVGKINQISRARCRSEFEQTWTDRHMAEGYIRIYQQLLSRSYAKAATQS